MDAKTRKCDGVAGRKYPSLLEGFTDGHNINGSYETSCIYPKGFIMFLSYCSHRTSIRPIRSIRGRETSKGQLFVRYYLSPKLRQISLLSQEFWIVPQKRIGKSLLNEEKGIPLQPQTRKLHSETLTY